MRSEAAIKRLELRVERLERKVDAAHHAGEADLARARSLLYDDLREGRAVEPVEFAAKNNLKLDSVERAIEEFLEKGWAVPDDDEAP